MTSTTQLSRPGLVHRAGWLLVLFIVVAVGLPTPRVEATNTICVALVVDFSPLGGNVDSGCTKVPSGANGYDVLRAGGHRYQVCGNGIIGTIDGQPANGCRIKDSTHFWGYWHRKPGSRTWTFSNYGAASYQPVEGSTEGWVWEDGSTDPPANVPYPSGCHSPPRSPSPTPRATSPTSTSTGTSSATVAGSGTRAATSPSGPTATTKSRRRSSRKTPAHPSTGAPTPPTSATDPAAPTPPPAARAPATSRATGDSNQTAPVLAGVSVAALLGGGAWWRFRKPAA